MDKVTQDSKAVLDRTNIVDITIAEEVFRRSYPTFSSTSLLDKLRATEYARLDKQEHLYLDYTGGCLYAECQLREHLELLSHNVFGNPHSINPTSQASTNLVEQARASVLEFFRASPDEYTVIFTPNASGALKLIAESYPFVPGGHFLLTFDNHNSVNGIREFARTKGANFTYIPLVAPDLRVDESSLFTALQQPTHGASRLFAYPAQSNFSGVQHPLAWIAEAQSRGWDVLVDSACFVPTNRLDLSIWHPDFVPLSFYKMFGYPTGIGCLLARKAALAKLQRPWFAGGTIWAVSIQGDWHVLLENEAGFEDGTLNYLSIPAVKIGLDYLTTIGMETIHERVMCLADWLLKTLISLRHHNGSPLLQIYGPTDTYMRGGNIAFNFLDSRGSVIDERIVEARAASCLLSLRTGCFCNPGAGEAAFGLQKEELIGDIQNYRLRSLDSYLRSLGLPSGGAIRVSLGLASNFADVYRFVQFARTFLETFPAEPDLLPRSHC